MEEGAGERREVGGSRFDPEKTGAGGSKTAGEVTWPIFRLAFVMVKTETRPFC
jgi:hypothetical protein